MYPKNESATMITSASKSSRRHPVPRLNALIFTQLSLLFLAALGPSGEAFATTPATGKPATSRPAASKPATSKPTSSGYAARADVREFVDEMVREQGFDRASLLRLFADARYQPKIIAAMQRPLLAPPKWYEYAPSFLSPARVEGGVAWWHGNAAALARAEATYGVPAEIIVAIVGVETFYGRNMGSYRVLDALTTLAFDYPRRATFFRGELRQFLLLSRDLGVSPTVPKGSFAGALGVPQFMPGSYRNFAVDFDGDGRANLWTDGTDVVGSVANFLARHDWQRGQPVLLPAVIAPEGRDAVLRRLDGGISERRPLEAWAGDGVTTLDSVSPDIGPVGLLMLEQRSNGVDDATYWIACNNFYVITRYNRSRLYATAVYELGNAIRRAREAAAIR